MKQKRWQTTETMEIWADGFMKGLILGMAATILIGLLVGMSK